jgi:putative endonuclease
MPSPNLGRFGEAWAAAHLSRLGYEILDRNVRYRCGELDIVARDGHDLVFVEVKCRRSARFGSPEAAIDRKRFARLEAAVQQFLVERHLDPDSYRIDVVALEVDASGKVVRCEVLRGVEAPAE